MLELAHLNENHPFSEYVRILGRGKNGSRSLTQLEAYEAMTMILAGEAHDAQIGAFLMLLRVQEESAEELAGFVKASHEHINAPEIDVDVNWSSYAGKKNQYPWNLLAAKLLANNGLKIFLHGAYGTQEGRLYTQTSCEALGIRVGKDWQQCQSALNSTNIVYMPMAAMSPIFNELLFSRRLFGLRSAMHSIARLANPLNARISLQGIFHPSYGPTHQGAAMLIDQKNSASFKGEGGEAEIRPEARTKIHAVRDGNALELTWPKQIDFRPEKCTELNPSYMQQVWTGEKYDEYGTAAVISTAALVLYLKNTELSTEQAIDQATQLWANRDQQPT